MQHVDIFWTFCKNRLTLWHDINVLLSQFYICLFAIQIPVSTQTKNLANVLENMGKNFPNKFFKFQEKISAATSGISKFSK